MRETDRQSPLVAKKSIQWDGLRLEHYSLARGCFPEHQHAEHAVIVAYAGACRDELQTPDGFLARCAGTRGSAIVLPAQRPHTIRIAAPSEYVSLFLAPAMLARAAAEAGMGAPVEVVESCTETDHVISNVALALMAEFEQAGIGGRVYAESLANILTVHLLRHYTAARPGVMSFSGGLTGRKLRRVLDYMADNHERDLSLAELAGAADMSAFHFAREFKRATGRAPHQYLIKLRVERAKLLLAESKLPLVEVSLRTGFSSQSHFTRLFRRLTGLTPGTYRDSLQAHYAVAAVR